MICENPSLPNLIHIYIYKVWQRPATIETGGSFRLFPLSLCHSEASQPTGQSTWTLLRQAPRPQPPLRSALVEKPWQPLRGLQLDAQTCAMLWTSSSPQNPLENSIDWTQGATGRDRPTQCLKPEPVLGPHTALWPSLEPLPSLSLPHWSVSSSGAWHRSQALQHSASQVSQVSKVGTPHSLHIGGM